LKHAFTPNAHDLTSCADVIVFQCLLNVCI